MLRLEKRPNPSQVWGYLAPILAVITTMIGGGGSFPNGKFLIIPLIFITKLIFFTEF